MFFDFFCRLNSRYLTEEQKGEMTRERKRCIFHLITYSVHVLVDSTWMWVSPQECWSYIGRYSWAHGTGGSIDKSSAVNAFDFAWVIPWTLTVYDESHSMSSHGIKKVSNCNELLVTYSFHILVDSKVRLTTGILIIYWKVTKRTNKKKEYSECTSLRLFPSALMVFIVSHAIHVISQLQETFVLAS